MSTDPGRPVPAARRRAVAPSSTPSTGLLINVIRSLTSSVSEDQRELEKRRLEIGFRESEATIDNLVKAHKNDVEECLDTFRDVSTRISACRERIHNVRNALHTCKSLLENRRDDLKKLWIENAQQRHICEIMTQLEELKDAPLRVDIAIAAGNYQEAAKIISNSRDLIDGKLSCIEGLSHLRTSLQASAQTLASCIVDKQVNMLVVDPFEKHMVDVVRSLPEQKVQQSEICQQILEKSKLAPSEESLESRLAAAMIALSELEGDSSELDRVLALSGSQIEKQINVSVSLIKARAAMDDNPEGDQSHLTQLIQMVVCQLESSRAAHQILEEIFMNSSRAYKSKLVMSTFWDAAQTAVVSLVSDHLDITPLVKEPIESKKLLFRFDASAAGSSTASNSQQNSLVVCPPSAFNMVAMFPWLRRLIESIEKATDESQCKLRLFVHSFVMELFVERVKNGLAEKMETALKVKDSSRMAVRQQNVRILPLCERMLDLCKEVQQLIINMDLYADRFAALWLLLLTEYNKCVQEMYDNTTKSLGEMEGTATRRKISAAWTADEDISRFVIDMLETDEFRLLMSLPNWQIAAATTIPNTPTTPAVESEQEIRARNERESGIMISNLGTQRRIERSELIEDMADIRDLACLHESLRWSAVEIRQLYSNLPPHIKDILRNCMVQVRFKTGEVSENEPVLSAMDICVGRLEAISDRCLLMLHLEIRIHCFFHLLPIAHVRMRSNVHHEENDPEVAELGNDLRRFNEVLTEMLSQPKLRYIFDGLGHLCAAIFIHTSQHMPRLNENAKKRICRDVYTVQQRLSQITKRREAELERAKKYFELLSYDPERLLAQLPEKRHLFSTVEMTNLVGLAVRSHAGLANEPGALDHFLSQLNAMLSRGSSVA